MPKNAPCAREATIRPVSMSAKLGATADSRFPAISSSNEPSSMRLRETRVPSPVITGAPATTPSA